ncbi:MAG: response regulator transcription factor [FCB group bacterium]|nr:response regulator transcription factor [FCB group bacterium]
MISVLIADDHPIVRKGLKQILEETSEIVVAAEACSGQEAIDKINSEDFDVVLLDISMPGIGGLEALKQIRQFRPALPVLILSMHPEEQYAFRAMKSGASGYLTKDSVPDELISAVKKVFQGGKYITLALAERLAVEIEVQGEKPLHQYLSNREYQVLLAITGGKTLRAISEELYISPKTVSTYRTRILEKMKMKTNADLTRYVMKNRLLDN